MFSRPKNKRKRSTLALDFFTPLSPQECQDRLLRGSARFTPGWQRMAKMQNPNLLTIQRLMIRRAAWWKFWQVADNQQIIFAGRLIPHDNGTLVQGQIRQRKPTVSHFSPTWIFVLILLLGNFYSIPLLIGIIMVVIAFLALHYDHHRQRQTFPKELLDWIHDQLCDPPDNLIDSGDLDDDNDEMANEKIEAQTAAHQRV